MMSQLEFENAVKKMKHRYEENDLKKAVYIADKIDWNEVNDVNLLLYVAMIYEDFVDFDMAKKIVSIAFEKAPIKSRLFYAMTRIHIKAGDLKKAREFYIDFCTVFPNDPRKNYLKYLFLKKKGASSSQKSRILEEYIEEEKDEEAMFELALIYEDMNEIKKMISTCQYIVDFFGLKVGGSGRKALELKARYEHLTAEEEDLLRNFKKAIKEENTKTDISYQKIKRPNLTIVKEKEDDIKYEKIEKIKRDKYALPPDEKDNEVVVKPIIRESKYSDEIREEQERMAFMKKEEEKKDLQNKVKEANKKTIEGSFDKFRLKSLKGERKMRIEDLKQHMIIEAYSREEALGIAQEELDMLHKALHTSTKKAKVSAYNLNERGLRYYEEKLGDRDLIIENAGQLKYPIVDELEEFIIRNGKKNIIVLIDIINNFDKLAFDRPSFLERFDIYSVLSEKKQEDIDDDSDIKRDFGNENKNSSKNLSNDSNDFSPNNDDYHSNNNYRQNDDYHSKDDISSNDDYSSKENLLGENKNSNNIDLEFNRTNQNYVSKNENRSNERRTGVSQEVEREIVKENISEKTNGSAREVTPIYVEKVKIDKPIPVPQTPKNETYKKPYNETKVEPAKNNIKKVKDMNIDEFVECCKEYATSIDCFLSGKTIPALYECIEEMVERGEALTEKRAADLIEAAADKAEKPRLFYKPKYDKSGNLILLEEHFLN